MPDLSSILYIRHDYTRHTPEPASTLLLDFVLCLVSIERIGRDRSDDLRVLPATRCSRTTRASRSGAKVRLHWLYTHAFPWVSECLQAPSGRPCDRLVVDRAAAVSKAAGQPLEMEEVEVAPPRAHEVLVRIICTSLCHTDITFWRMKVRIKSVKCFGRVSSHDFLSFNFRFSSI